MILGAALATVPFAQGAMALNRLSLAQAVGQRIHSDRESEERGLNEGSIVDAVAEAKAPWTPEAWIAGKPNQCRNLTTSLTSAVVQECSRTVASHFFNATQVLLHHWDLLKRSFNRALFLGSSEELQTCRLERNRRRSSTNVQLVVDAGYSNRPRCCDGSSDCDLMLAGGEVPAGVAKALGQIPFTSVARQLSYYSITPAEGCDEVNSCGLVVQIPGAANIPWFLLQERVCPKCKQTLRSMLLAPLFPINLGDTAAGVGTSSHLLRHTLFPLVEEVLFEFPSIDRHRVYLVAESRGVDTGLRAVLMRPDLFTMAAFSGTFALTNETLGLISRMPTDDEHLKKRRLKALHFYMGDLDSCFDMSEFLVNFTKVVNQVAEKEVVQHIGFHVYPQGHHSLWFASWNSLHDVIWTGTQTVEEYRHALPLTCSSCEGAGCQQPRCERAQDDLKGHRL